MGPNKKAAEGAWSSYRLSSPLCSRASWSAHASRPCICMWSCSLCLMIACVYHSMTPKHPKFPGPACEGTHVAIMMTITLLPAVASMQTMPAHQRTSQRLCHVTLADGSHHKGALGSKMIACRPLKGDSMVALSPE